MKNINELIGIIKGINFDGVINDREIENLRSWVDKNRNLVYEAKQVKLVQIVDEVLEDNVITDEERELLLACSEEYLQGEKEYSERIYELNGIIEGIVCDGVVNEQEVYHLSEWMNEHGSLIKAHKPAKVIYDAVNGILEDGIVTKNEQMELLQILSEKIRGTQFKTKIEYLRKLVRERKNIGIDLIDILDDQEAMDKIHEKAELQLFETLDSYSGMYFSDPEIVFISLCLIGMLEYDGTFYEHVRKVYANLYMRYSTPRIEGYLRSLMDRYRADRQTNADKSRIINIVLSNAIVPRKFLKPFYEFIFDIYKLNFDYNLPKDLYEEFKFIYEGLRSNMKSEGDTLQINVTKKTYKLIQTTKNLIAGGQYYDPVIQLSILIVKLIDKRIWNKKIKLYNPYLKYGFDKWDKDLDASGKRTASEFRSRWESKFILSNNEVFLIPSVHKVKSSYNYRNIAVVVLADNREIYVNASPDVREIIGGYQISVEKIKIDCPLEKITYRLTDGQKVIYDSKKKLYRSFIVFDTNGNEIKNNTDYKGTACVCYKKPNEKLEPYFKAKYYKLAAKNVNYGDYLLFGDFVFNFSSLMKPGIFGNTYENQYLVQRDAQDQIPVYKDFKYLVFETENKNANIEIVINNVPTELKRFNYSVTARAGINKYVVDIHEVKSDIYDYIVNQISVGKTDRIAKFKVALDKDFKMQTQKLSDETFFVSVKSDLFEGTINKTVEIETYSEEDVSFVNRGNFFSYCLPFDFDIYRVVGSGWKSFNKDLWIGDIESNSMLDIYDSEIDAISVYSETGQMLETVPLTDKGVFKRFNIGFLLTHKNEYTYLFLVFLKEGKKKRAMFCNNKCILKADTEILFDTVNRRLNITPRFYGKGNVYFNIKNENSEQVYKSEYLKNESLVTISNLESYKKYHITFYEKEKGLSLNGNRVMKSFEEIFYAREDLVGKTYRIGTMNCSDTDGQQSVRYPVNLFLHLMDIDLFGKYSGELFVGHSIHMRSNLIKPVEVITCSEVINGVMEVTVTRNEKNIAYDNKKGIPVESKGTYNEMIDSLSVIMQEIE